MTSIEKAIAMAVSAHADQRDKEGASYILHPLRIAMNFVGAEHLFCIAMLHDVVEDTLSEENEITIADVEREFGKEVSVSVDCLTRRPKERYLEEYIPRVARDKQARIIKLADLNDNLDPVRISRLTGKDRIWMVKRFELYLSAMEILNGRQET